MDIKILMVDDDIPTTTGYQTILEMNEEDLTFQFTKSNTFQEAYSIITNPANKNAFNLIILDRSMKPYPEKKILSGEDLIEVIHHFLPNVKILIITSHAEKFSVYDIIHKNRPDGMMIKSDVDDTNLVQCVKAILNDESYHSQLVKIALKEEIISKGLLDTIDRLIITLLSQGFRNVTISDKLGLSTSAVEKRKATIKDHLGIIKGTDEDIIKESRRLGYI